jgi:asparagine synthase (glutamine-hydrolysing)
MCGICGILHLDGQRPVDRAVLTQMNTNIFHRGPDDEGYHLDGSVGLAMRRLSIIDIAGGRQPIFNEDRSVVTVFNGEIYNYSKLRLRLESQGHTFATNSDTEVLVHLYEEYGENLMHELNGMFAFAIYDSVKKRLLLARDRLGVKPLYYWTNGTSLVFGSEVKSFLALDEFEPCLDTVALHHYLTFRFVPAPLTLFRDVKKLEPGHYLDITCGQKSFSARRYWDVDFSMTDKARTLEDAALEVQHLVKDAVKMRLISEVPLGMMLSGGIDSAVITAAMAADTSEAISTFTIDYEEDGPHREGVYARIIADAFKTAHYEILVGYEDFMSKLESMVYFLDEPIADPAAIPIFDLCKFSRKYVTVMLSGVGGDELYGGYGTYSEALYRRWAGIFPAGFWRGLAPLYPRMLPGRNFMRRLGHPVSEVFLGSSPIYGGFSEAQKAELYTPEFRRQQQGLDSHAIIAATLKAQSQAGDLHQMMYVDIKHWLADSHLIMMDKMSMAASIELRTPLLDYRLVQHAARLPQHFKRTLRGSKVVFKNAFAPLVPEAIINRKKRGFSTPLDVWFKDNGRQIRDYLIEKPAAIHAYCRKEAIASLFRKHDAGQGDQSASIFTLLVLESWIRKFCKRG